MSEPSPVRDREQAIKAVLAITQAEPQGHRGQRLGRHGAERIVDALLPQLDSEHPEPLLRAVADAIDAECPEGKTYSAMVIADVALGALRRLVPQPDAEWREAVELLSDALGVAMLALQDFVDGKGPRGPALLPLLLLADAAADKRDEVLAPRNDPTSDPTGAENASAEGGSGC